MEHSSPDRQADRTGYSRQHISRSGSAVSKKGDLKPWLKKRWCIGKITGEYLALMEDILGLYEGPYDPKRPEIGVDERPCQLIGDIVAPIPMKPVRLRKEDNEYERNGTCSVFIACEPLTALCGSTYQDGLCRIHG